MVGAPVLASHNSMGIEVRRLLELYFNDYVFEASRTCSFIPYLILLSFSVLRYPRDVATAQHEGIQLEGHSRED